MPIYVDVARELELTPGEASAIALFDKVYTEDPDQIKKLLESHDQKFTGDPNIDFMQVYMLSKERERYFNDDYVKMYEDAKYFKLGDLVDKVKDVVEKVVDKTKDVASQAGPAIGQGLKLFAPVAGMAANSQAPGSGFLVSAAMTAGGNALTKPKEAAASSSLSNAVKETFSVTQTDPKLDNRSSAQSVLQAMTEVTDKKILGMKPMWFWISLTGLIIVILTIVIIAVRKAKKKKEAAKLKAA